MNVAKLLTPTVFGLAKGLNPIGRHAKTLGFETNHWISRAPSGRCSSYSTVSKYSLVLRNCKVWAPSDHWWWRYSTIVFFIGWTGLTMPALLGWCRSIFLIMCVFDRRYLFAQTSLSARIRCVCTTVAVRGPNSSWARRYSFQKLGRFSEFSSFC